MTRAALSRVVLIACLASVAAFAADVTGKWEFNVQTDAGGGTPTFVFKQAGEKLTGTYNGTFGTADLAGTVKGDNIEFSFEASLGDQKGTIVYKGKIEGPTTMKGSVELAGLGSGTWTGTKKD
ncbi:conserved exported hypothetical protein [Candidatus Sulfopaludibacter sp. SbA4]|nr:conserved exported hypothetical protein [Candidatus Sulfopaludibacter sp. SbA4]